ncbi:hypothetical protein Tco_0133229 [Tanacetum coccineum]
MDTTRAQQKTLDDKLVDPANRLKIGKSNLRLSSNLKSKEPTLQVALDALKLTPFYNAFEISADVPEIYMQEFWVTVSRHHSSFRQKFEEPPLEEDILSFIRDPRHTGEIKFLFDVNVNHMHQPWRSFAAIINKCLSGKTTALENLVFQVENKNSKKNNDMYYPRFTKVIIDYFMAKDQAIPRRNKMFWHYAKDEFMFTTSEAYMTYRAYAIGEKTPKPKSTKRKAGSESSPKTKPTQASKGKRIKTSAKGDKPAKIKQSATKLEGEDDKENDEHDSEDDNDKHDNKDDNKEHDSANDNEVEDDDQENVSGETELDDDRDDFVHPNLSTYKADDQEEEKEEEQANDDHEVSSDQKTKEVHVTLTTEPPVVQQQSSSISSDLVSKFINPSPDTGIDLILNPNVQSDIPVNVSVSATTETPSSDTTIPQLPIPIIQPQQQTHDSTTTTIPTTTLPKIPNFASLFRFERRVSSLETELSKLKQTNQFTEAVSSIPSIVDNYLTSKMKDAVNVAIQLQSNQLREEAQSENDEFLK